MATARKLEQAAADPLSRGAVKPAPPISLKPGTRLVREWRGITHTSSSMPTVSSARSVVAREITGARSKPLRQGADGESERLHQSGTLQRRTRQPPIWNSRARPLEDCLTGDRKALEETQPELAGKALHGASFRTAEGCGL